MRVATVEMFVDLDLTTLNNVPSMAVRQTLVRNARKRNEQALSDISAALKRDPEVIECPGWTFVGNAPPAELLGLVGKRTLIFELLPEEDLSASTKKKDQDKGQWRGADDGCRFPWRTFVMEAGQIREVPRQVIARGWELNDPANAETLATTLMSNGRRVAGGKLFVCGESNALRIRRGAPKRHIWDPAVEAAGAPAAAFAGLPVFNPAHTPSGSRMHEKRRCGPWKAIVTTANQFDRKRLGLGGGVPQPTRAYVNQQELEPVESEDLPSKDRVLVFELP